MPSTNHSIKVQYPGFLQLTLVIFLLNIVGAQILHEVGHWAVMQAFGRRPLWGITSMVQLWDRQPQSPDEWVLFTDYEGDQGWLHLGSEPESDLEWLLFIAAGPLAQLLAVAAGLFIAYRSQSAAAGAMAYLLALVNAFGGTFYQLVTLLRGSGGDEILIGHYLDVPARAVSAVLGLAFAAGLFLGLRALSTWRQRGIYLGALFLATLPIGPFFALANRLIIDQVDAGNPLFRSILGFSLPVFAAGLLCFLGLWFIARRWQDRVR